MNHWYRYSAIIVNFWKLVLSIVHNIYKIKLYAWIIFVFLSGFVLEFINLYENGGWRGHRFVRQLRRWIWTGLSLTSVLNVFSKNRVTLYLKYKILSISYFIHIFGSKVTCFGKRFLFRHLDLFVFVKK